MRKLVRDLTADVCKTLGFDPKDVCRIEIEPDVIYVHTLVKAHGGKLAHINGEPRTKVHPIYFYDTVTT